MEKIKIGKAVNAVGITGEIKVYNYSDYKERFEELEYIYLDEEKRKIKGVRYNKNMVILKLEDVNTRNEAELLKNKEIFIDEDQLRDLPQGTYYVKDMIGMEVIDEKNERIGRLSDVILRAAQDIYEIERQDGSKALIPAVEAFVKDVDMEKRVIRVELIEGLLEL